MGNLFAMIVGFSIGVLATLFLDDAPETEVQVNCPETKIEVVDPNPALAKSAEYFHKALEISIAQTNACLDREEALRSSLEVCSSGIQQANDEAFMWKQRYMEED